MNNKHSLAQYGHPEDDDDWNIMAHRRHSTDTTCTLHDFMEETTTVWNFATRTIHSTEWMTDRTYNPRWTSQKKDYKKEVYDREYCPEFMGLAGFT